MLRLHFEHTWEDHPKRKEYLAANHGWGMCDTGARIKNHMCLMGGIGCSVDHLSIGLKNNADTSVPINLKVN